MEKSFLNWRGVVGPILLSLMGVVSMSLTAQLLNNRVIDSWPVSTYDIVNYTFTMQMMVLPVSLVVLLLMFVFRRNSFRKYFRSGISFSNDTSEWNVYGPVAAIGFTIGTVMLMSFSVMSQGGAFNATFFSLIPLVLLFSATNAWSEEVFTRFVIVAGLEGKFSPNAICWISAIIFGVPHFFGTPSGISGVFMSGFLGWVLAKSVVETKGMGWALVIHFLQDVAIFGAGAMMVAK